MNDMNDMTVIDGSDLRGRNLAQMIRFLDDKPKVLWEMGAYTNTDITLTRSGWGDLRFMIHKELDTLKMAVQASERHGLRVAKQAKIEGYNEGFKAGWEESEDEKW